jgi:hypothetical protein
VYREGAYGPARYALNWLPMGAVSTTVRRLLPLAVVPFALVVTPATAVAHFYCDANGDFTRAG